MTDGGAIDADTTAVLWMNPQEFFEELRRHQGETVRLQVGEPPPRKALLIAVAISLVTIQFRDREPADAPIRVPIGDITVVFAEDSSFGRR
ncbi:MAG: hypothetical protein ACREDE_06800 [Thermoplasmata archaeon]